MADRNFTFTPGMFNFPISGGGATTFTPLETLQLDRFALKPIEPSAEVPRFDRPLMHYTSAAGALAILQSQSLLSFDIKTMNDPYEFRYGREMVRQIIDQLMSNSSGSSPTHRNTRREFYIKMFLGITEIIERDYKFFATSFAIHQQAKHPNFTSRWHWRNYARLDGVCMLFDPGPIQQLASIPSPTISTYFAEIQYGLTESYLNRVTMSPHDAFYAVRPSLSEVFSQHLIIEESIQSGSRKPSIHFDERLIKEVLIFLLKVAICVKRNTFLKEEEYRLAFVRKNIEGNEYPIGKISDREFISLFSGEIFSGSLMAVFLGPEFDRTGQNNRKTIEILEAMNKPYIHLLPGAYEKLTF